MPEQRPEPEEQHSGDPAAEQDGRDEDRTSDVDEIAGDVDLRRLEEPASRIGRGDPPGE